jgi:hypothetical protein
MIDYENTLGGHINAGNGLCGLLICAIPWLCWQCRRADPMHAFAELRAYDDNQDFQ